MLIEISIVDFKVFTINSFPELILSLVTVVLPKRLYLLHILGCERSAHTLLFTAIRQVNIFYSILLTKILEIHWFPRFQQVTMRQWLNESSPGDLASPVWLPSSGKQCLKWSGKQLSRYLCLISIKINIGENYHSIYFVFAEQIATGRASGLWSCFE